jgi:hypothetical protein
MKCSANPDRQSKAEIWNLRNLVEGENTHVPVLGLNEWVYSWYEWVSLAPACTHGLQLGADFVNCEQVEILLVRLAPVNLKGDLVPIKRSYNANTLHPCQCHLLQDGPQLITTNTDG